MHLVLAALVICNGYIYSRVFGMHLMEEGSGPCINLNFSHLLWSYGACMYYTGHVCID